MTVKQILMTTTGEPQRVITLNWNEIGNLWLGRWQWLASITMFPSNDNWKLQNHYSDQRSLTGLCLTLNFSGYPETWCYFVNHLLGKIVLISVEYRRICKYTQIRLNSALYRQYLWKDIITWYRLSLERKLSDAEMGYEAELYFYAFLISFEFSS